MSFINKFKDFMGIGEEDFEDDFEENEQPEEMEDDPFGGFSMQPEYRPGKTEPAEKTAAPRKDNKVVNINTTTQLQVVLVKPEKFEDASGIADHHRGAQSGIDQPRDCPPTGGFLKRCGLCQRWSD